MPDHTAKHGYDAAMLRFYDVHHLILAYGMQAVYKPELMPCWFEFI
jgi:hypothetical protein